MWHFFKLPVDLTSLSVSPLPETPADDDPAARGTPTRKGTVLWFDKDKGYGRIRRAEGGGTVIIHYRTVE
jgi:'Cold-shock' DNA-binding domain